VRRSNGGCVEQTPLRIEPEPGKVMEDFGKAMSDELSDILQQDVSGSNVTDDPADGWPEPTIICNSGLGPCGAEGLAGETGSDNIHSPTPRSAVKGT